LAIPSQPTATTIVTEAYNLAGISSPSAAQIVRATNYGLEKVKRDIMNLGKAWKPLLITAYHITKAGVSHYANPSDFSVDFSVGHMTGTHSGALTAVASASVMTLAADEDVTQAFAEGKWLLITSGTGTKQAEQIDDYNATTKVATLRQSLTTAPAAGDGYLIVDSVADLARRPLQLYDKYMGSGTKAAPTMYFLIETAAYGEIAVYPVPDAVAGLRYKYYADLLKTDLDSALYSTILRRWAGVFTQGAFVWVLQDNDDTRAETEKQVYFGMLANLAAWDMVGHPKWLPGQNEGGSR